MKRSALWQEFCAETKKAPNNSAISDHVLAWLPAAQAVPLVLYDDSLNNLPQNQGWLTYLPSINATQTRVANGARLDTADPTVMGNPHNGEAGYLINPFALFNPQYPPLDPGVGFRLSFQLQIHAENHVATERAGFSVLLLGSDALGIELGFWEDEIWAQNANFTHGEGNSGVDTTTAEVLYELTILGSDYFLKANSAQILAGTTRDYRPAGPAIPYAVARTIFLGDDTDSAYAEFTLGDVSIQMLDPTAMPAPAGWVLMLIGLAAIRGFRADHTQLNSGP